MDYGIIDYLPILHMQHFYALIAIPTVLMAIGSYYMMKKTEHTAIAKRKIPKIVLWTAPRCVSTAFERAIMQIPNGKVFHEPFSVPFYFGPQKVSARYKQETDNQWTYEDTVELLSKPYEDEQDIDFVFSKDMAYYVTQYQPHRYYSHLLSTGLCAASSWTHTFLIRRPDKLVASLYKASINEALTGWNYFDRKEIGLNDIYMIYNKCSQLGYQRLVIIDADDLLANPARILKLYCDRVGLAYSDDILSWQPGPIETFQLWQGWHDAVINSSGFKKSSKQESKQKEQRLKHFVEHELPTDVQQEITKAFDVYNQLFALRLH